MAAGASLVQTIFEDEEILEETDERVLLLGDEDDSATRALLQSGRRCYTKDMITLSALRGRIEESDEFLVKAKQTKTRPSKRRRTNCSDGCQLGARQMFLRCLFTMS